jgi:hypothetical protein
MDLTSTNTHTPEHNDTPSTEPRPTYNDANTHFGTKTTSAIVQSSTPSVSQTQPSTGGAAKKKYKGRSYTIRTGKKGGLNSCLNSLCSFVFITETDFPEF